MRGFETKRDDGYLPIESYAALGDGRSVALAGADGSIDWWCVPQLDSPPLFDRLLDAEEGGYFSIQPEDAFTAEREYLPDSNVLSTVFRTARGAVRLTESLNSGVAGRLPWSELARRLEGLEGEVRLGICVRPGNRLQSANPWVEPNRNVPVLHLDDLVAIFRHTEDVCVEDLGDTKIRATVAMKAGSRAVVALIVTESSPLVVPTIEEIDGRIDSSDEAWRVWTGQLSGKTRYENAVRRSALALKLLLFSPTGAVAAAATTSLPERIGGQKNYDYRFAWLRDAAYTVKALLRAGAKQEVQAAFAWILAVLRHHGTNVRVFYTLNAEIAPEERELPLPGYRNTRPVRYGNRARTQRQLNGFGDLLETAAVFTEFGNVLDTKSSQFLSDLADRCADEWRQPDSGIWELEDLQHYTFSKIGCWMALNRAVQLAEQKHIDAGHCARWQRERDRIRDWIDTHCWSEEKQAYTQYAGSDKLDASLLLATRFQFERKDRLDLTRIAIQKELCRGPLVYRYTGVEKEEGAFWACSFWLVEAFAFLGHVQEAETTMEELLELAERSNGLLAEMIDPDSGHLVGNSPQGLSHLALIHAANAITDATAQ